MLAGLTIMKYLSGNGACRYASMVAWRAPARLLVRRDGDAYLPQAAVLWIIESADFKKVSEPQKPDPRAAYFRRGWPHRSN